MNEGITYDSRVMVTTENDHPVSQAAPLHLTWCMSGMSAQWDDLGLSSGEGTQLCRYLQIAEAQWQRYQRELKIAGCRSADIGHDITGQDLIVDTVTICKTSAQSVDALNLYRLNIQLANELVSMSKTSGAMNQVAGDLFKPVLMAGGLIYLLLIL